MNKLLCKLFGHKWKILETDKSGNFYVTRKMICKRCGKEWNSHEKDKVKL